MSSHMGLLQKANLLSQKKGLAFCEFIKSNNISKAAIFVLNDKNFYIQNSYGFDGTSLLSSKSTLDFWTGFLQEKSKVYNFSLQDDNLTSILQFFSFNLKDSIENVKLVRTGEKIYLICNSELPDSIMSDFYTVDKNYPAIDFSNCEITKDSVFRNYEVSTCEAIKKYIESKNLNDEIYFTSLNNEVNNRLYFLFSQNNFYSMQDNIIRVSVNSTIELSPKAIEEHVKSSLKEILENCSSYVSVKYSGNSESIVELKNFLKAE